MAKHDTLERQAAARLALKEYSQSERIEPIVFQRRDESCPCDILRPTPLEILRLGIQYGVILLANLILIPSLKNALLRLLGARIGRNVFIAPGAMLDPIFPSLIELEDGAMLGLGCHLLTHDVSAESFRVGRIRVGKGSVIGAYSTVRPGIRIGGAGDRGRRQLCDARCGRWDDGWRRAGPAVEENLDRARQVGSSTRRRLEKPTHLHAFFHRLRSTRLIIINPMCRCVVCRGRIVQIQLAAQRGWPGWRGLPVCRSRWR